MQGDMLLAFQVPQGNLKLLADAHPEVVTVVIQTVAETA